MAQSSLSSLIRTILLFLCPQICPLQTVGGRRGTREWWRDPRCHPTKPLRPAHSPRLPLPPEPQTQRRGREPGTPLPGASQLSALRTHRIQAAVAPGPRWLRHPARRFPWKMRPPGSLPAQLPAPGSLLLPCCGGQWAPRLPGWAGGAGVAAAPPRGRPAPAPADPDPAGAGREVLTIPLPFHPARPQIPRVR